MSAMFAGAQTAQATGGGLEGIPSYAHVFVLVLENEDEAATWSDSRTAHYLNGLRRRGVFVPNYFGTGHASLDNYIAMVSGQPDQPLSGSDCESVNLYTCVQPQSLMAGGRNLGDQLDDAHISWKGYMDSMPSACFHADYSPAAAGPDPYQGDSTAPPAGNYADRHNPFIYFPDIIANDARCRQHELPFTQLRSDIRSDSVPRFAFITPDTCHDGHDAPCAGGAPGGLTSADSWVSSQLPSILSYLASHDGLLLITTDESGVDKGAISSPGCCSGGAGGAPGIGGQVGLLAVAPNLKGATVMTQYDHMSLLRTIEDSFGISQHLNNAAAAKPMADIFANAVPANAASGSHAAPPAGQVSAADVGTRLAPTGSSPIPIGLLALALLGLGSRLRRSRS